MLDLHTEDELYIAKQGFRCAKEHKDNWFAGVNCCPYGPGVPGNGKANAWYAGWWFFFYIVKPWSDLIVRCHNSQEMRV